jgi:hypothetical protein
MTGARQNSLQDARIAVTFRRGGMAEWSMGVALKTTRLTGPPRGHAATTYRAEGIDGIPPPETVAGSWAQSRGRM